MNRICRARSELLAESNEAVEACSARVVGGRGLLAVIGKEKVEAMHTEAAERAVRDRSGAIGG